MRNELDRLASLAGMATHLEMTHLYSGELLMYTGWQAEKVAMSRRAAGLLVLSASRPAMCLQ